MSFMERAGSPYSMSTLGSIVAPWHQQLRSVSLDKGKFVSFKKLGCFRYGYFVLHMVGLAGCKMFYSFIRSLQCIQGGNSCQGEDYPHCCGLVVGPSVGMVLRDRPKKLGDQRTPSSQVILGVTLVEDTPQNIL